MQRFKLIKVEVVEVVSLCERIIYFELITYTHAHVKHSTAV